MVDSLLPSKETSPPVLRFVFDFSQEIPETLVTYRIDRVSTEGYVSEYIVVDTRTAVLQPCSIHEPRLSRSTTGLVGILFSFFLRSIVTWVRNYPVIPVIGSSFISSLCTFSYRLHLYRRNKEEEGFCVWTFLQTLLRTPDKNYKSYVLEEPRRDVILP